MVQPTCSFATGTITITSATASLKSSLNGGANLAYPAVEYPEAAGLHALTVQNTSGCTSSVTNMTVNAKPATPVVGTITQPTCSVPTGSVVISGLPESGSWTITRTPGGVTTTGTGASTTISALAPGTYTFTVTNAEGCRSAASTNLVITQPLSCGPVDPNKCYYIMNVNSSKYLDISSSSTMPNSKAVQRFYNPQRLSERWRFTKVETVGGVDYYTITNLNSNLVLGVDEGAIKDGAKIRQNVYAGANYQKWSITVSGSALIFKAKHSGKSMSVKSNSQDNGADVIQENCFSEKWIISEGNCFERVYCRVNVHPNPSTNYFNLAITSTDKTSPIKVRILDLNGTVKAVFNNVQVNKSEMLKIEALQWPGGTYIAEITQGNDRQIVKMIKLN